jgi:hypothetical protein
MNDTCPHCAEYGIFGYRNKETGVMTWYCANHRLGQYWADARRDNRVENPSSQAWEGWARTASAKINDPEPPNDFCGAF